MAKWMKGKSGNPGGRPKRGHSLSECLRAAVDGEKLAGALCKLAYAGNIASMGLIFDRVEGRPASQVELSGRHGGPIRVDHNLQRAVIEYLDSVLDDSALEQLDQTLDHARLEGGA